jgi:L-seryl-tRNA(Ser) seleniumtransferase
MDRLKISAKDVQENLRNGNPSIELNPATGGDTSGLLKGLPSGPNVIVIGVWMMEPGEAEIVARRLRQVLSQSSTV